MCGCAARWIWPSTNKPSLIRSMKDTRKLRWRQCRRCNGRMTTRCKTRRAILKSKSLIEGGRLSKRLYTFFMESALDWYKSKPAVNSRNDSVRLGKNRRQSKDRELRGGRVP